MTYEEYKKLHPEDAENTAQKLHINLNNNQQNMQNNMQNLNNTNTNQQPPQRKIPPANVTLESTMPHTKISNTFFNKRWFTKTNIMGKYIIVKDNLKGGLKSLSVLEKNNLGILPFHFTIPCFTSVAELYKECDYDYQIKKYNIDKENNLSCSADFKLRISIINPINFISTGNENEIIETKIEHDFDDIVIGYFNKHKIDVITGDIYETNSDDEEIIKDQSIIGDEIEFLLKNEKKFSPSQERLEMEEKKIKNNANYTDEEKRNLIEKLHNTKLTFEEYYGIRINSLSINHFSKPSISQEITSENIELDRRIKRQEKENILQDKENEQIIKNAKTKAEEKKITGGIETKLFEDEQRIITKNAKEQAESGVNVYNFYGSGKTNAYILNQGQVPNENNDKQNSNTQNKNLNLKEILNDIRLILINKDIPEESKTKIITEKYNLSQEDLQELLQTLQNSNENENEIHKTK